MQAKRSGDQSSDLMNEHAVLAETGQDKMEGSHRIAAAVAAAAVASAFSSFSSGGPDGAVAAKHQNPRVERDRGPHQTHYCRLPHRRRPPCPV